MNANRQTVHCPCKLHKEEGKPCVHMKALTMQLAGASTPSPEGWCDQRCHTESCWRSYSAPMPGFLTAGRLKTDPDTAPPDHQRSAGRRSKKRKERSQLRTAAVRRECEACGHLGHFAGACTNPSTHCRCNQHKAKALLWCQKQEEAGVDNDLEQEWHNSSGHLSRTWHFCVSESSFTSE